LALEHGGLACLGNPIRVRVVLTYHAAMVPVFPAAAALTISPGMTLDLTPLQRRSDFCAKA